MTGQSREYFSEHWVQNVGFFFKTNLKAAVCIVSHKWVHMHNLCGYVVVEASKFKKKKITLKFYIKNNHIKVIFGSIVKKCIGEVVKGC